MIGGKRPAIATVIVAAWLFGGTCSADVFKLHTTILPNTDLFGMDLGPGIPSADPDSCRQECTKNKDCAAFTHDATRSLCFLKSSVPSESANSCCVSGVYRTLSTEIDTDRPGMDIPQLLVTITPPTPEFCRDLCGGFRSCRAYTYVRPGALGPTSSCNLKSGVPTASPSQCCVSGMHSLVSTETDTARFGMDYMVFNLSLAQPEWCRQACSKDTHCHAYTYVNPTPTAPAQCLLKSGVPAASSNQCCVSGTALNVVLFAPESRPSCIALNPAVGCSIFGCPPIRPEMLSSSEVLKSIAKLSSDDPTKHTFDIAVYTPSADDAWEVWIEQFPQPPISSNTTLIALENHDNDGLSEILTVDSATCAIGTQSTRPCGLLGFSNQIERDSRLSFRRK
ncbi:PAN domain-containing protein, partial [Bradyrhizobium sp. 31Argb]|uniref:PAN domain-containing protein n=1 Tax=Bradyrhizobium sp. 31Argb TaxID=3141247 RepID=UPI0037497594